MMKKLITHIFVLLVATTLHGQDPHFSQFFMAPQLLNPATTGTGLSNWRIMSNFRQQWGNAGTPFNTNTLTGDIKILGKEEYKNTLGMSMTMMSDQSLNGAFKSTYISGAVSYHLQLDDYQRIGAGFQGAYGNRRLDYSQLTFGEQFTSGGFDATLPSGEAALLDMKSFLSLGAGMLYNFRNDAVNIDIGIAGFHLNSPIQTFTNDPQQIVPLRTVVHSNVEFNASDGVLVNFNGIYQQQSLQHYFAVGGAIGLDISNGERKNVLYAGGWYRERDAWYPYLGLLVGAFQLGLSYDVTASKQNKGAYIPRSVELSLVIRNVNQNSGNIPCPWK